MAWSGGTNGNNSHHPNIFIDDNPSEGFFLTLDNSHKEGYADFMSVITIIPSETLGIVIDN